MELERISIVAPCYNEGEVALRFLIELEQVLHNIEVHFTIVLVDDASTDGTLEKVLAFRTTAANVSLSVLSLPINVGHQEAIHQGLLFASTLECSRYIVMDSDGQDDPNAIRELVTLKSSPIVFVARGKRTESFRFRVGYLIYRALFRWVAGRSISFGNFSMIDHQVLQVVLARSFTHYAAFLSRLGTNTHMIVRDRRPRIDGTSKMSSKSLSMHAFRSLVEYSEELLSIFIRTAALLAVVFLLSVLVIVGIKLFTHAAIPGWASTLSASLFNSVLICSGSFAIGLLLVHNARKRSGVDPRIYRDLTADRADGVHR